MKIKSENKDEMTIKVNIKVKTKMKIRQMKNYTHTWATLNAMKDYPTQVSTPRVAPKIKIK